MALFDADLGRKLAFLFGAVFGLVFVVAGLMVRETWLVVFGIALAAASVGFLALERWSSRR